MLREDLYQSIYTHDTIYLPPHEQTTAALEVSLGCSWHKCTFCDFAKDTFCIHPIEKLEHDLQILGGLRPEDTRLFFLGENAFCMSAGQIFRIIELTRKYMPKVREYAMYSRIDDILRKTEAELRELAAWDRADFVDRFRFDTVKIVGGRSCEVSIPAMDIMILLSHLKGYLLCEFQEKHTTLETYFKEAIRKGE